MYKNNYTNVQNNYTNVQKNQPNVQADSSWLIFWSNLCCNLVIVIVLYSVIL